MNIVTDFPWWFSLFCILAGFAYAFILYRKEKKFAETPSWLTQSMAVLRFLAIALLCFLLLSPLLRTIHRSVEKPVIIIALDDSESLISGKDSGFYRKEYKEKLSSLQSALNDKYEVKTYSFADEFRDLSSVDSLLFRGKQTNISDVFSEITTRYSNRNVGAIILASDGLYNIGSNPLYSSGKLKIPVYTIALGDTTIRKDAVVLKVEHNRLAYLGNEFPLEIVIAAKQLKGKNSVLTVSKGGATLFTKAVSFNSDSYLETIPVLLEARETGLQHYKIRLSEQPEEFTLANNVRDIFIDVLDARQKILILAGVPHPDVAAIKQSIESNRNYEVESYRLEDFDKPLKKYNLVILHQLPGPGNSGAKVLSELNASDIPIWSVSGASALLRNDLTRQSVTAKTNEVEPILEKKFPLFTISDEFSRAVKDFPAVLSPFGSYQTDNSSNVLLYQRIGIVETKTPLLLFNSVGETKVAVFAGEGLWKWRLQDFASHGSHELFDELISKIVQYLSVKVDKSFFKVTGKNNFLENEAIELEAEVYNESYELINEPEVTIVFSNSAGKKFPYTFSKTSAAYRLNAGRMPVGEYKYEAKVKAGGKMYSQRGEFSVSALQVELTNTVADHQLLYSLAKKHNGEMVYPAELEKLSGKLNAREDIKSVSYSEKKLNDIINLKWIFFILLILLSLEWFIRKRNGAY